MTTVTPYRSKQKSGSDGFGRLLRAEWTKFRTVRGWVVAVVLAAVAAFGISVFLASNGHISCSPGPCSINGQPPATGPGGLPVNDAFYFVHQTLDGNSSITARVTALTSAPALGGFQGPSATGLQPWAKTGLIIKASMAQGSAYAAIMVTASHGVRMQYNYTHDIAGPPGAASAASPRWLRLTRSGDTVTGYESGNGTHWTKVGTTTLAGFPHAVQAGLFTASPDAAQQGQTRLFTAATGVLDHVSLPGGAAPRVKGYAFPAQGFQFFGPKQHNGGFTQKAGTFAVTGSGDIGPYQVPSDKTADSLLGVVVGLIVVIAVAAPFITAEYRRGIIHTTLAVSPRRGRVLAAKAIVIGLVSFIAGLAAAAIALPLAEKLLQSNYYRPPWFMTAAGLTSGTGLRIILGTGALFAITAVLAVGLGTIVRRSAVAITMAIAVIVLPEVLEVSLPQGPAQWLQEFTPAAAFGIHSSIPRYPQVACYAVKGCYPLPPWAGLGVFALYAVAALALGLLLLRRRDA